MNKNHKPEIFNRRCCFNCRNHSDYIMTGPNAGTVACPYNSGWTDEHGTPRIDYSKRIRADHVPCKHWILDTNIPKGCSWPFLNQQQPQQLNLF